MKKVTLIFEGKLTENFRVPNGTIPELGKFVGAEWGVNIDGDFVMKTILDMKIEEVPESSLKRTIKVTEEKILELQSIPYVDFAKADFNNDTKAAYIVNYRHQGFSCIDDTLILNICDRVQVAAKNNKKNWEEIKRWHGMGLINIVVRTVFIELLKVEEVIFQEHEMYKSRWKDSESRIEILPEISQIFSCTIQRNRK